MLIARSACAGTSSTAASLQVSAPAAIVTDALPPNASARSLPAVIVPPDWRSATWAAEMTSGDVEKRLVNFTFTCEPPIVVQAISRSVWLLICEGTVAWTLVLAVVTVVESGVLPHAVTQAGPDAAGDAEAVGPPSDEPVVASRRAISAAPRNERRPGDISMRVQCWAVGFGCRIWAAGMGGNDGGS